MGDAEKGGDRQEDHPINCATNLLNAGAELVDIQARPDDATLTTTQIDTNVEQDRMVAVVARL